MSDNQFSNRTKYKIHNDALRYSWAAYNIFILLSSLIGDTTILVTSIKYRAFKLHKFIVVVIKHIAACDLMVSIVSVFSRVVSLIADGWVLGNILRYVEAYGICYFNVIGLILISVMTSSELLIIKFPIWGRHLLGHKGQRVCVAVWVVALALPIIAFALDGEDVIFDFRLYGCRLAWSADIWTLVKPVLYGLFILVPNVLVVVTTSCLLIIVRKFARRKGHNLRWESVITTILVAITYCISVLPYTVYIFISISEVSFADDQSSFFRTHYSRLVTSLILINTVSNFYIYSLTVASFRTFMRSFELNLFNRVDNTVL